MGNPNYQTQIRFKLSIRMVTVSCRFPSNITKKSILRLLLEYLGEYIGQVDYSEVRKLYHRSQMLYDVILSPWVDGS